jgi:tetratricopeptide (TPR) repeat protein
MWAVPSSSRQPSLTSPSRHKYIWPMRNYFPLIGFLFLCSAVVVAQTTAPPKAEASPEAQSKTPAEINETVLRAFRDGNAALSARNYDEAVNRYDAGLKADPQHPGAPVLLTNESVALRARGVDRFNTATMNTGEAVKNAGLLAAKDDFLLAAQTGKLAVDMLKAQAAPAESNAVGVYNRNKYFALAARFEAVRLVATKVDQTKTDDAIVAYQEYLAVETDPVKKLKLQDSAGQMLFDLEQYEKSLAEFQKTLAQTPGEPDANLGAGMALFGLGNKSRYQEAANYIQRFLDTAPVDHRLRPDAQTLLDTLKAENILPQKKSP